MKPKLPFSKKIPAFITAVITLLFPVLLSAQTETLWIGKSVDFSHGKLKISENKKFLVFASKHYAAPGKNSLTSN